MNRCFVAAAGCSSFGLLLVATTPIVRVVGLTFALFAAVVCFWDMGCDGAQLRIDFGQLLDQFLGISWHNIVQTIVFVLNLDGHIAHQETAHGEARQSPPIITQIQRFVYLTLLLDINTCSVLVVCRLITKTADRGSILSWAISIERFPRLERPICGLYSAL